MGKRKDVLNANRPALMRQRDLDEAVKQIALLVSEKFRQLEARIMTLEAKVN
jgi:hypothetical protein